MTGRSMSGSLPVESAKTMKPTSEVVPVAVMGMKTLLAGVVTASVERSRTFEMGPVTVVVPEAQICP